MARTAPTDATAVIDGVLDNRTPPAGVPVQAADLPTDAAAAIEQIPEAGPVTGWFDAPAEATPIGDSIGKVASRVTAEVTARLPVDTDGRTPLALRGDGRWRWVLGYPTPAPGIYAVDATEAWDPVEVWELLTEAGHGIRVPWIKARGMAEQVATALTIANPGVDWATADPREVRLDRDATAALLKAAYHGGDAG